MAITFDTLVEEFMLEIFLPRCFYEILSRFYRRRYAFAMYTTETEASNAIRLFNNYMIRPSWQLGKYMIVFP